MNINQAIILAGGLGTRLKPLTDQLPKPMVSIAGRALLAYHVDALLQAQITNISIKTFYKADIIEHFINRNYPLDLRVDFIKERGETLGTAGFLFEHKPCFWRMVGCICSFLDDWFGCPCSAWGNRSVRGDCFATYWLFSAGGSAIGSCTLLQAREYSFRCICSARGFS